MKSAITTTAAPKAIGPYSQGIEAQGLVFVSGQLPVDPQTGVFVPGGAKEQAGQSLKNVQAVLKAAGLSMDDVVKTTVFIKNMQDFAAVNEVYATFFTGACPARSCFEVAALPKGALVEIEAIAAK